jgi:hypothetical protein
MAKMRIINVITKCNEEKLNRKWHANGEIVIWRRKRKAAARRSNQALKAKLAAAQLKASLSVTNNESANQPQCLAGVMKKAKMKWRNGDNGVAK